MLIGLYQGGNMFPQVPLLQLGDYKAEQVQKNIVQPLNQLLRIPFIDGILIKDVSLGTTTVGVQHKLNRQYTGYFITKLNANAVIWIDVATESDIYLKLKASATCVVDLWVF